MPKRKVDNSEEEFESSEDASASEEESLRALSKESNVSKKKEVKTTSVKNKYVPKVKKSKLDVRESASVAIEVHTSDQTKVLTNSEGDKYLDLGKKKRAVVRSFKGIPLLDIREYYGAEGEEKPGKKGISLTLDQWQMLREGTNAIDKLFAQQKK